ncbi:MAG TPA: hypothetical protein VFA22_02450 [Stellaceae bacterium]|nr:hypothetical protein [Stellaceae bacterium]
MNRDIEKLRADLIAEIDGLEHSVAEDRHRLDCLRARLEGIDAAVAAMRAEKPPVERRRSIRAEVYAQLDRPRSVDALVAAIGRVKRKAVEEALRWHELKGMAEKLPDGRWRLRERPDYSLPWPSIEDGQQDCPAAAAE